MLTKLFNKTLGLQTPVFACFGSKSPFPSLTITSKKLIPQGSYAKMQAEYLNPDHERIKTINSLLEKRKVGLVAHFYMDAELQGVISRCNKDHVYIADSLAMGQAAISQAKNGLEKIIVLGVDFMTENVRALLDRSGFEYIPVYKLSNKKIGCSLAEAAEKDAYLAYLKKAATVKNALHVIYINTSLMIKGKANEIVPTITCTSSNVVKTILQSFEQNPEINLFFGPDTYMGENLLNMFKQMATLPDSEIKKVHPAHDRQSISRIADRFNYFRQGNCIVHHYFDGSVVENVKANYQDSFVAGHLEVPGEMFRLALEKQSKGQGVIGSTSDILNFILAKVKEETERQEFLYKEKKIRVVLGTESGMITMIVNKVQEILNKANLHNLEVEIIFPVSQEAISVPENKLNELPIVPGVSAGEGCSAAGGCASCPFMKMNTLDALEDVLDMLDSNSNQKILKFKMEKNKSQSKIIERGIEPIMNMQYFQQNGRLATEFLEHIRANEFKGF